jgi:hypothetical protein
MSVSDHYQVLMKRSANAQHAMLSDQEALVEFTKSHNLITDFEHLHAAIADRPEAVLLQLAIREYQFSLYAASFANYRYASMSLRLFLELSLATVHFSAYELRLRKWLNNTLDIVWSSLIDPDCGVFAKAFIMAFNPGMENLGKQYSTIAEKVYRECSEFVHGNLHTHSEVREPLEFDRSMLLAWTERADAVRLSIIFAFAGRYLRLLSVESRNGLEALMIDNLGHIPAVRELYGK